MLQVDPVWILLVLIAPVALLQWWALRRLRGSKGRAATGTLLQQSQLQYAELQHELAWKQSQHHEPHQQTRGDVIRMLRVPARKLALPSDGFPETMPSMQFQFTGPGSL